MVDVRSGPGDRVRRAADSDAAHMMATASSVLPIGPAWSYEVKCDGYRTLAVKDGDRVTLLSRNLKHLTNQYTVIAKAVSALDVRSVTLDGEIVAIH